MILLSVDLGKARTGVAVSDEGESFAFPKTVITEYNPTRLIEKIIATAKETGAKKIIVGYPKNMDGSAGERAQECAEIAREITRQSGLETVLWDERCTTVSAHALLNATDTRGKKRKQVIDAVAAVIILEDYLRYRKTEPST